MPIPSPNFFTFIRLRACIRMHECQRSYFLSEEKLLNQVIMEQITMEQNYTGIDVAKYSFVAATRLEGKIATSLHQNNRKGIAGFLKSLPSQSWCIMEAEPYQKNYIKESNEKSRRIGLRQVERRIHALKLNQSELEKNSQELLS